jgi:hypothetical protein
LTCAASAVLATSALTPASAATPTSFAATTRIGATPLPQSLATGEWTLDAPGTTAKLHVAMPMHPSPADTHVTAGWASPFVRTRGRCFGQYDFSYKNWRLALPTPHFADRIRYRVQGGPWSRWTTEWEADYDDVSPDLAVGRRMTDDCVFVFDRAPRRPVQLEIRHVGDYGGTHQIQEDLVVRVP